MAEKLATLSFSDGTPSMDFPVLSGTVGPDVIDVRALYAKTGKFTYDPGFMSTASCRSKITYIDGDEGILHVPRLSDRAARRALHLPRSRVPDPERRAAEQAAARRVRRHRDASHDGARAALALLPRVPPRCAPDGGAVRRGRRAVRVLPRLDRHQRSAQPRDLGVPPDREAADDHGDDLQVQRRASRSCTRRTRSPTSRTSST